MNPWLLPVPQTISGPGTRTLISHRTKAQPSTSRSCKARCHYFSCNIKHQSSKLNKVKSIMPPSYILYTPEASFRAFATLIAAEYNGVNVDVVTNVTAEDAKSPVGKLPVLETPSGEKIFSSYAAARFIAGLRRDTGLTGSSPSEAASIDAWMDFAAQEVELPACVWFYPVAGYMPFNANSYEKSKADLAKALKVLNDHLNGKTYIVGNQITLADIVVASTLLYPFKLVADQSYLKPYDKVLSWFTNCVSQEEFQQVVGQVTMCKKELKAPGQSS